MHFFKNINMTVKIVALVLILQFFTIAVFTYFQNHGEEKRIRASIDSDIKNIAHAANDFVLRDYHDRITGKESISEDEYMDLLVRLSAFADKANIQYIYSFMKYEKNVIFTSTSATKEDFKNDDYESFFDVYEDASQELIQEFSQKNALYEETAGKYGYLRSIFLPFINKYGEPYIVGVDIKIDKIEKLYENNRKRALKLAAIVFLISGIISALLIHSFLKPVALIRDGLQDFFDYLNHKRTSVSPVKINSSDELGEMGKLINKNIEIIAANIKKDNELIHEITTISEQVKLGKFSSLIHTEADNPALNDVKNIMNEVFSNMQVVMLDILNLLVEFSKKNYSCKLDNYNLDGEMGKLVVEISTFSKNTSDYMLNKAYDSINLDKDSNFINENIESLTEQLYRSVKQIHALKQTIQTSERFSSNGLNSLQKIKEQQSYTDNLFINLNNLSKQLNDRDQVLTQREILEKTLNISETIDDLSKSMEIIESNRVEVYNYISKSLHSMSELLNNFDTFEEDLLYMRKSVDNTKKISGNLKKLSEHMKSYIEESIFDGKENINVLMNNTDR